MFFGFIFALFSLINIAAQSASDDNLKRGGELFAAGSYGAAIEALTKCVEIYLA